MQTRLQEEGCIPAALSVNCTNASSFKQHPSEQQYLFYVYICTAWRLLTGRGGTGSATVPRNTANHRAGTVPHRQRRAASLVLTTQGSLLGARTEATTCDTRILYILDTKSRSTQQAFNATFYFDARAFLHVAEVESSLFLAKFSPVLRPTDGPRQARLTHSGSLHLQHKLTQCRISSAFNQNKYSQFRI